MIVNSDLHDVHTQYVHGMLSLTERAWGGRVISEYLCRHIQYDLDPSNRSPSPDYY